ncbi:putative F-box protein [Cardamine amara subsp. amara]|uniref:F-box protein n=1 Tax=Cardamine amara subsp. amara TaxID=228776 RepID=A0ABD1A4G3_CARAN
MEKNHNPNSHECLRGDASNFWSDLPLDLLNSVFQRLSFANFQRAKAVCSSWYSASRQSPKKNQIPWLILFPKNNNDTSCTLFNPEEKDKLYKTKDLIVDFAKNVCIATYGSWLLMKDHRYNLHILNLFTGEKINLPPVESQLGMTKIERTLDDGFRITNISYILETKGIVIRSPVLWIDEKTKDYVVLWALENWCVVYAKKGDNLWNQIPGTLFCVHMVYKDHKLYFLRCSPYRNFRIFDFSGEIPRENFEYSFIEPGFQLGPRRIISTSWSGCERKLVLTITGDVLKVVRMPSGRRSRTKSFRIFKVYSSELLKKHEQVDSLGDEAMLFDLGVTVPANEIDGLNRNSIYFKGTLGKNTNAIFVFNLETQKMEPLRQLDCSSLQLSSARWFLPSFTH